MRELALTLDSWLKGGHDFALASVVQASGSAPRPAGSLMAVRADGLIAGSVSGGCVEGAVVEAAMRAMRSRTPELLEFGPESDAPLFEVGLSCGGRIRVWVEPVLDRSAWSFIAEKLIAGEPVAWLSRGSRDHPGMAAIAENTFAGDAILASRVDYEAVRPVAESAGLQTEIEGETVFVTAFAPPERLVVVGAVHIAVPLVAMAKRMGFETIVVDPRSAFAKPERFPDPPGKLLAQWPEKAFDELGIGSGSHVVTLTHDPKIDDRALFEAVKRGAAYIGALGSRKTQEKKRASLLEMGLREDEIGRIHGPVGLDIGAETPEEIALSILAEIVKFRRDRGERPMPAP